MVGYFTNWNLAVKSHKIYAMRSLHLITVGLVLALFLFCTINLSSAYTLVANDQQHDQNRKVELNKLELSGWDFLAGNLPDELSGITLPRSLKSYCAGAYFCVMALLGLLAAGLFARRMFNPARVNLLLLAGYLVGFIQVENFKNAYFHFAESRFAAQNNGIIVDSHMTLIAAFVNGVLLLLAVLNVIFIFNKKMRQKHYYSVH